MLSDTQALDGVNLSMFDELLQTGKKAIEERRFSEALTCFQSALVMRPDDIALKVEMGVVLRELNRFDEAQALLQDVLATDPDHQAASIAHAWVAHARSDWPEAIHRWRQVVIRWPDIPDGYFGGGAATRYVGDFDAADEIYREAFRRVPISVNLLKDFAWVAHERQDWGEAEKRWKVLQTLNPEGWDGYIGLSEVYLQCGRAEEAETMLRTADQKFPQNPQIRVALARSARSRGDLKLALQRWDGVVSEFHGLVEGYLGATDVLVQLGRIEDAQNVLLPALRMFPNSYDVAQWNCWLAHHRRDWEAAIKSWRDLRSRFPTHVGGYTGGIAAFKESGQAQLAEELTEDAAVRFPNDVWIRMEQASLLIDRQNWREAEDRLKAILDQNRSIPQVHILLAKALVGQGRADEADRTLRAALELIGFSPELQAAYCEVASNTQNWPEAIARWRDALTRHPNLISPYIGLVAALRNAGNHQESDDLLATALKMFPDSLELELNAAQNASIERDWPRALDLWAGLKRRNPNHEGVRAAISEALWQARQDLGLAGATETDPPFTIPPILLAPDDGADPFTDEMKRLFMGFESLGDTCEFGIVQRRFGAEPLSLLRWASTGPNELVVALNADLDGVGEPENTILEVIRGEYTTRDKRYHMFSHTFTPNTAMAYDKFYVQQCRRIQFLKSKLLDDLRDGEKIFVYKSDSGLTKDQALALHAAVRRFCERNYLLCVRLPDQEQAVGHLERIADGLFIGYTDRFSTVDINVQNWIALCRQVVSEREAADQ